MIKTKRKGKNRKSSFDDEGFVKFRISISSFHLLQFKLHCTLHPRVILYYNERIFREFVLSKEKKKIGGGKFTWNRNSNFWKKSKASFLIRDSTPIMPIESRFPWLNNRKFLIRRKHASRAFNV